MEAMDLPVRAVRRVAALGVVVVFFPVTFRHGATDWANTEARHYTTILEKSFGPLSRPAFTVPSAGHSAAPLGSATTTPPRSSPQLTKTTTPEESKEERDDLTLAVALVVASYRACLKDNATALARRAQLEPDSLAMAALAHACVLLEELDRTHLMGNNVVAGLLYRAHTEAVLTAAWLFLGREASVDRLLGDLRRSVRFQHEMMARSDERGAAARHAAVRKNEQIAEQNRHRRKARERGADVPDLPEVRLPVIRHIGADLSGWWDGWGYRDVPEAEATLDHMDDTLGPLADEAGLGWSNWDSFYNLIYRWASKFSAHPTYWVLDSYTDRETLFRGVRPFHPEDENSASRTEVMVAGALCLTAQFAA